MRLEDFPIDTEIGYRSLRVELAFHGETRWNDERGSDFHRLLFHFLGNASVPRFASLIGRRADLSIRIAMNGFRRLSRLASGTFTDTLTLISAAY